jgi:hypothetical protein
MRIGSEAPKRVAMASAQHARRTSSTLLILFGPCLSVSFPRSDRIEELTDCFVVKWSVDCPPDNFGELPRHRLGFWPGQMQTVDSRDCVAVTNAKVWLGGKLCAD